MLSEQTPEAAIEARLKAAMGLCVDTVGASTIGRAVRKRMTACGISDTHAYLLLLQTSQEELKELIETVVIPETWFFRDHKPFVALTNYLRLEWLPENPTRRLRALSIPCSTGEEPYSIAMALLDAGLTPDGFRIDAVDISRHNLEKARRAEYTANSFRGKELGFRARYFQPTDDGYRLDDKVRDCVNFAQKNLLDNGFIETAGKYDIVFCRNLLIYFDRETQQRALGILERLLHDKGILFMGHAETGPLLHCWHPSTRCPEAFAFRKFNDDRRLLDAARDEPRAPRKFQGPQGEEAKRRRIPASSEPRPFANIVPGIAAEPERGPQIEQGFGLLKAAHLANQGHLAEAAQLCEGHLRDSGPSAQAYFLLGVIRAAAGNQDQAGELLRKAVYMDPHHHEALVHLAVLTEQQGDTGGAAQFRQRAERALRRQQTKSLEATR